jgi:hypothetical protein
MCVCVRSHNNEIDAQPKSSKCSTSITSSYSSNVVFFSFQRDDVNVHCVLLYYPGKLNITRQQQQLFRR